MYNHTLDEIEKWEKEEDLCDPPKCLVVIGRMEADPKKLKEVYELGRMMRSDRSQP